MTAEITTKVKQYQKEFYSLQEAIDFCEGLIDTYVCIRMGNVQINKINGQITIVKLGE